ncbi:hypothetical protein BDQ17DRAFT_1353625 [Cyathus striatus]|nr:hypothetical protein BDQ17DRAFT_1353625 [Cyathus striatus]
MLCLFLVSIHGFHHLSPTPTPRTNTRTGRKQLCIPPLTLHNTAITAEHHYCTREPTNCHNNKRITVLLGRRCGGLIPQLYYSACNGNDI